MRSVVAADLHPIAFNNQYYPTQRQAGAPPPHIFEKIVEFVITYFKTGQGIFIGAYGLKELCFDGIKQHFDLKKAKTSPTIQKIERAIRGFLDKINQIKHQLANFYIGHGLYYLGTGAAAALAGCHELGFINLGQAYPYVNYSSSVFFGLANALGLISNVSILMTASQMSAVAHGDQQTELAGCLKNSAILGIISSSNYLIATTISMAGGGSLAPILFFGGIGLTIGGIKIGYDYFAVTPVIQNFGQKTSI